MNHITRLCLTVTLVTAIIVINPLSASAYSYASGVRNCPNNVRGYIQVWKNSGTLRVYAPGDWSANGVLQVSSYLKVNGAYGGGAWGVDGTGSGPGSPVGDIYKIVTGCNKAV